MSTGENAHRVYRFGEYSLDLDREALYRADRELHLRPKSFRVLRILLENSGRLVSKAELHEAAWKQSVVTDDSLAHCIADIRHALGKNGFEMIKTVPRRGYVFDYAVSQETEQAAGPPPERTRIAYGLGAVTAGLAAAFLLLLGSGRGNQIPTTGADTVDDVVSTVFEADPSSTDIDAFNEYEKGRFFFKRRGKGDLEHAEACFKAALEQDPEFAAAWIGLAGVYSVRFGEGDLSREEALPLLGDATGHALRLAPDSAEAHVRRADYYRIRGVPLLARQHLETALTLDPDDVLVLGRAAGALVHGNRLDEAIELQRRAVQGDPTSALQHSNLVWMLLAAGRYPEAADAARQYHALYPPGVGDTGELFADVDILQRNFEQALIKTRGMSNGPAQDRNLAIIHHALGQEAEADSALQRLLADGGEEAAIHAAEVFAFRGETDEAMIRLSSVLNSPARDEPTRRQLYQDSLWLLSPYLVGLRSDERWQRLYAHVLEAWGHSIFLAHADIAEVTSK